MIVRNLLVVLLSCCFSFSVSAQGIRGQITNEKGEAVPFANIYIPKLSTGTTSNIDGHFELKLPEGKWEILFQYIGFQTQTMVLTIEKSFQDLTIQLIAQNYRIAEVKVLGSGEDPAYYIVRRAIAMAPYYQKQVSKYSCKVYLKGSGVFEKIPFLLRKQMKKDGVNENEPFVIETLSKIDFELPDQVKQQVLAMRSSGKQNNTSPMGMITNNLYDADKYGIVSPVGRNALKTYTFTLDGVFEDQGRTINKIKVTPKIKGNDVFSGYIYIADLFWNLHSADLTMRIQMADVNVHQLYAEVNKNTWMPVSFDFNMNFAGLGMKIKYKYVASVSEYKTTLNPALDHTFIEKQNQQLIQEQKVYNQIAEETKRTLELRAAKSKEQKHIDQLMEKPDLSNRETAKLNRLIDAEAKRNSPPEPLEIKSSFVVSQKQVKNDSTYWTSLRPIPLTDSERNSFARKDSFLLVSSTPEYKDSVRNSLRKFKIKHLLFGKSYNYSIDSLRKSEIFSIPNLMDPTSVSFNSVDGVRVELPFSYSKSDSTGRSIRLEPHFAYTFARKKLDALFTYSQRLDGMSNSWISASLGSTTKDFNRSDGLARINNDFYTLWREENFNRYYRRDFAELTASRDLVNGLNVSASVDYSDNSALSNHSTFRFIDYKNREIQPNKFPENLISESMQLENHQSFVSRLAFEYTPQHRYRVRDHVKRYAESKYPTFLLGYTGAFDGVAGSDSRFDLVKLGVRQKINFGIDDHITYQINAGKFVNNDRLYFEDFQHFKTMSTNFGFSSFENSFRLLPFYQYSTSNQYAEMHTTWQTRRLILKQLPVLKNSSVTENLFVNYLGSTGIKNYVETGYGIGNLFLLLNVEAVAGFENGRFRSAGVKVSLNLK